MNNLELYELFENLLGFDESEWIEFKKDNSNPEDIGEYLSALSNSACLHKQDFGYLIFGVENATRKIVGTKFKPKIEKKGNELLESWFHTLLNPKTNFEILELNYKTKPIIILKIDSAKR